MSPAARSRRQRGIALVVVLWVSLLLAAMAGAFVLDTRTDVKIGWNMVETAKARALADGGIDLALDALTRPETGFRPDGGVRAVAVPGGELRVAAAAEIGKIDLNRAPAELLQAILAGVGVAPEEAARLVDTIEDWRDTDDLRRLNGAEDADYAAAGLGYGAKDAPFEQVDELRQVLGMTGAVYRALRPLVTVRSAGPGVDPLYAPRAVLSVLPGMTADLVDAFLAARAEDEPEAALALLSGFVEPRYITVGRGSAVTVRSMATLVSGARFVREALIVPGGAGDLAYRIDAWRETEADGLVPAEPPETGGV